MSYTFADGRRRGRRHRIGQSYAAGVLAYGIAADDDIGHGVNDVNFIGKRVTDKRLGAVGREGNASWVATDSEFFDECFASGIDDHKGIVTVCG